MDWIRPLPRRAFSGERLLCSGRPRAGYAIEAITVHHETFPQTMSAKLANAISSYALPSDRREYLPRLLREQYSDGRRGDFQVADDGGFAFAVPFPDGPGIYTVVVWVRALGARDTVAASNVSVRVEAAPAHVAYGSR